MYHKPSHARRPHTRTKMSYIYIIVLAETLLFLLACVQPLTSYLQKKRKGVGKFQEVTHTSIIVASFLLLSSSLLAVVFNEKSAWAYTIAVDHLHIGTGS